MTSQPDHLLDICRHLIDGSAREVARYAGHDGTEVLRAATRHGDVIVKAHQAPHRHEQEVHAYQHWTHALGEHAPHLLATWDDPPAVVLTALDGQSVTADLDPAAERHAHRQAGELLHRLHHAAPPRPHPDMTGWLAQRGAQWLRLADSVLSAHQRTVIREHLRALAALGPIAAVPCHLDYAPRNLIWTPKATIAAIDFEHARYDLAARDLVRMARHVWAHRPDLRDAFLDGYGPLTETDRQVVEHGLHLDALTSAVRASGRHLPNPTAEIGNDPACAGRNDQGPIRYPSRHADHLMSPALGTDH